MTISNFTYTGTKNEGTIKTSKSLIVGKSYNISGYAGFVSVNLLNYTVKSKTILTEGQYKYAYSVIVTYYMNAGCNVSGPFTITANGSLSSDNSCLNGQLILIDYNTLQLSVN